MYATGRSRALAAGAIAAAALGFTVAQATAATSAQVQNGTLFITGTNGADDITLLSNGLNVLEVDINGDGAGDLSFDRSTFTAIDVQARGGDDRVTNRGQFTDEAMTIDGGGGHDTLSGGLGDQKLVGGSGNDTATGGDGDDTVQLGAGNDGFTWNPGDDNDVVEGEAGADVLDFNGSNAAETIDVSANGPRVRFLRNIANVVTDLGGVERIEFDALGGSDTIVAGDTAGTELDTFAVNLSAFGGAGDAAVDSVIAGGTPGDDAVVLGSEGAAQVVSGLAAEVQVTGGETQDEINVGTGDGSDTITANVAATGTALFDVDGGDKVDTLDYTGTAGADQISVVANGAKLRTGGPASAPLDSIVEDIRVQGLGGVDAINAIGNTVSSLLTFDGGAGADNVRGGNGSDVLLGGSGNDVVDGNFSADVAEMGSGNDRFQWDPGDGSDTVNGDGGTDAVDFNGSNIGELLELKEYFGRALFTRNIANITMSADVEAFAVRSFGGADTLTVGDMTGSSVQTVDTDLSASIGGGDTAADTVIANGTDGADAARVSRSGAQARVTGLAATTRVTGGEAALDTLRVHTLGGDDEVTIASNLNDLIGLGFDLGADD
jgi:Ca2+-binding RTX toxin-like protein